MQFDNFFTGVIFPPGIVWILLIGVSHLIRNDESKKEFFQKFAHVTSAFLFGILFIVFAVLNLTFPISILFYVIGGSLVFYSYAIYSAYD